MSKVEKGPMQYEALLPYSHPVDKVIGRWQAQD